MPRVIVSVILATLCAAAVPARTAGTELPNPSTLPESIQEADSGWSWGQDSQRPWWIVSLVLFVFCVALGVLAVLAGIGGAILYVPFVSALFPFHIDFVRGAGLFVSLAGALSAAPDLLKRRLISLRLVIPLALSGAAGSLFGARIGLRLPAHVVSLVLGAAITGILILMSGRFRGAARQPGPDALTRYLGIGGKWMDEETGQSLEWTSHRLPLGLILFVFIGFLAGMLGIGAGWANVPALNLLIGVPLKLAVATSVMIIAVNGSVSSWVYLNQGALIPVIAVPSVVGMMLGTRMGVWVFSRTKTSSIRRLVFALLILAAVRQFLSGLGILSR